MTNAELILVPTHMEREAMFGDDPRVAVCGFGLAEAGARAAHAIATAATPPARLVLAGLAGTYDAQAWPVGTAVVAGSVRCHGIGAGGLSPAGLGFSDHDVLRLAADGPELLSVATASASPEQARERHDEYPEAALEEMEGFAVAVAAAAFGVPLVIVRGVSNAAGDRDQTGWRVAEAARAVRGAVAGARS